MELLLYCSNAHTPCRCSPIWKSCGDASSFQSQQYLSGLLGAGHTLTVFSV